MTMADVIASRISLSIPSPEDEPLPPAERPGKLTAILGGVDAANYQADGTVTAGLYRSSREELDDVVWRIKRAHLDRHIRWNDMAVITHDNAAEVSNRTVVIISAAREPAAGGSTGP